MIVTRYSVCLVWISSQKNKSVSYTKSGSNKAYLSFHLKIAEVNESRYTNFCINYEDCAIHIFHFSCTELSGKLFFGRYFYPDAKGVGLPHIAYMVIHKL